MALIAPVCSPAPTRVVAIGDRGRSNRALALPKIRLGDGDTPSTDATARRVV
jgi:hypothetical protein